MTDETRQQMLKDALGWSMEIGCCPDKERFALRVWDLFDKLGISAPEVPNEVVVALKAPSWRGRYAKGLVRQLTPISNDCRIASE